jgi:hypothetical protein
MWKNEETSVLLRSDNIIIVGVIESATQFTLPAAKECVEEIQRVIKLNNRPNTLVLYAPDFYINKDVMRCYADTVFGEVGIGVISQSFIARFVGNIAVTIRNRFIESNPSMPDTRMKVFKNKEACITWCLDRIKQAT